MVGIDASELCNHLIVDNKCNISYNINIPNKKKCNKLKVNDKDNEFCLNQLNQLNQFEPYRASTNAKLTKLINKKKNKKNLKVNTKLKTIRQIINNKVCSNFEFYDPSKNKCTPLIEKCKSKVITKCNNNDRCIYNSNTEKCQVDDI